MPDAIPAEILQQQANTAAPGAKQMTKQDDAPQVAKTRQQPGQKGKKTAAAKVYPKIASQADGE